MALADLLQALEAEVDGQIARILADARDRATELTTERAEQVARRTAAAIRQRETEILTTSARDLARARHEAVSLVLRARAAALKQVFDRTRAAMSAMQPVAHLERELADALSYLDGAAATVRCAPGSAGAIRTRVGKRPGLAVETDETIASGFRVHSADGTLEVDATLEGRLVQRAPDLAIAIWHELERGQ